MLQARYERVHISSFVQLARSHSCESYSVMILSQNITCPQYTENETFFAIIRFIAICGLSYNFLGLYIIHYHSPKSMAGYKKLLAFYQVLSGVCDITIGELVTPLVTLPMMAGVPVGLLRNLGMDTRIQVVIGFLAAFTTFAAIGTLFLYRANSVLPVGHWIIQTEEEITRHTIYAYVIIIGGVGGIQTAFFYLSRDLDFRADALQAIPSFSCIINDPYFYTYPGPFESLMLLFVGACLGGFMIFVGVCITSTYYSIAIADNNISAKTRKLQWKAMIILIGQVFIPLTIGVVPLAIGVALCSSRSIPTAALAPFFILLTSNHGVLSTTFILTLHPPYRKYVLDKSRETIAGLPGMSGLTVTKTEKKTCKVTTTSGLRVSHVVVL